MVIQLPKETEDELQKLADRVGQPAADQLAVDAINAMLARNREAGRWPRPKAVGIVSDGGLDLEHLDEWMAENWPEDW